MDNSPLRNQMQAMFLEDEYCLRLFGLCCYQQEDLKVAQEFESEEFDVQLAIFTATFNNVKKYLFQIQLQPILGDDYPTILRSLKKKGNGPYKMHGSPYECYPHTVHKILFVDKFKGSITREQLVKLFKTEKIIVVFVDQL